MTSKRKSWRNFTEKRNEYMNKNIGLLIGGVALLLASTATALADTKNANPVHITID
jgi:hypothetical protein